ncbi:LOB domain-containing protein 40 [Hibiscus syriacus]|uniref:LOB domain-containing protein 40 n=1 Tax=Hibiscus syriacus TaxID=106335 RepID=A0A6A3CLL4_HIBSY|nr:LOB domain-containing protein 42-like [Hibiscus syriacus]KAE8730270.1 LOB domain-containing protein 40 [Hibiscus syriacus]
MRMSCNGCRVLRKGCSESCSIRPCLQWIHSSDSQANATLFLAKFYGRAGLLNLIEAGPQEHRPDIFRSLLYEACGRVVNPVYGSIGMLWSGNWAECQAAVEAVLKGSTITQTCSLESLEEEQPIYPLKTYDIRHVSKDTKPADIDKVKTRSRARFKRSKRQILDSPNSDTWMSQLGNGDSILSKKSLSSSNVGLQLTLALVPEALPK